MATWYYSPVEITRIREIAESKGLLTPAAPEGYMSARKIAEELGVSDRTIRDIIKELDGLTPIQAKFGSQVTNAYSPEDIANISEVAESKGLLTLAAPEGYKSVSQIAKELEVGDKPIRDIIKELGEELDPIKARPLTGMATWYYSPVEITRIREIAESKGLLTPAAPEGYKSVSQIAKELEVSDRTIRDIIKELDGLTPIDAKFGGVVTEAYSPEDIAKISEVAESRGLLTPAAPEGYMSARKIAEELGVSDRTIKDIIKGLGGLTPIDAKFGSAVTEAYSPEAIATIREIAESRGLLAPEAPEGYKSVAQIAEELRASRATITDIIKELGGLTPIDAKFGSRVADAYSPEDIAKIREQLRIKRENKS